MESYNYNYIKLEHFVPFGQKEFESGKLKLITRYKSDVKFSLVNSNVTKIKIPKNLVNLEPGCFYGCKHLQSIEVDAQNPNLRMEGSILVDIVNNRPIAILGGELPEGITRIDAGLVTGNAESITIPASVTYIAPDAFIGFKGNIIVDENNETYWSYGNIIFLKADDSVWTFGYNVTWPSTLTSIPNYAFSNYIEYGRRYVRPSIETAIIEEGVTNIGDYAFKNCSKLTSVDIPSSITNIGAGAFAFGNNVVKNLDKINITSIESWCNIAFYDWASNPLSCGAFLYLNGQKITDLVIPNTVTKINTKAFISCNQITSVTISNSVEEIENAAFNSCTNLTSINVGSGLVIVDNNAFTGCSNVQTVTVSNENTTFYTGVNGLVRKNNNIVIISGLNFTTPNDPNFTQIGFPELQYNPVKSNLTLSPSVKRIYGNNSGSLSYRIQSITLNNTLEEIGDYTFSGGTLIGNITIPNTVTGIGNYAFKNQTNLTSITIPDSVISIGSSAFSNCTNLTSVVLPNNITEIREYSFEYTNLTSITIPNSVTKISDGAFKNCESLTSLNIPSSVESIVSGNYGSFYACNNLESITVDPNNTVYDSRDNCNAIIETATNKVILGCKNTILPNTVTEIASYAFMNLDLTNVVIPSSIAKIDSDSFYNCTGGQTVDDITYAGSVLLKVNNKNKSEYTIKEGTSVIAPRTFYNCSTLTSIVIPDSVKNIGYEAFQNCRNLQNLTLGSNLIEIGYSSFQYCKISSIVIPENVETIGNSAFAYCSNLTTVTINSNKIKRLEYNTFLNTKISTINTPSSIEYVDSSAFSGVTTLPTVNYIRYADTIALNATNTSQTSYTVKEGTRMLANSAFRYCSSMTSVSLPEGLAIIGDSAFYNCTKLTSITIPNSVTKIGNSAFYGCSVISEVNIDSLEHWLNIDFGNTSANPFYTNTETSKSFKINGTEITTLTIPNSITKIKDRSLYNLKNSSVTNIIVPNSVKEVGEYALNKCNNVDIDISNLEQISAYAFWGVTFINTNIVINNSIELQGTYQFSTSNITKLTYNLDRIIPNGFCTDCANLTDVTINSEVALTQSTMDSFTAATIIKVPCNLYPVALQGIFKTKAQPITDECLQYRWIDDKEICIIPELHMRQKKQVSLNGTDWYDTGETQILPEVLGECTKYYEVELNNGAWVTSTSYGNLSSVSSDYQFYESTNHSDSSSNSMIITINGYDTFTFKVRNYSETGYDYVYVNNLDDLTSTNNNAYYSNVNKSSASTWYDVTFSNISTGEHQIKITYRKDGSSSSGDDKGFVAIPIDQ